MKKNVAKDLFKSIEQATEFFEGRNKDAMGVKNPKPMHPGRVLASVYMEELGLSQSELARRLDCTPAKINEIINGRRGITPKFAILLEALFGTDPEMWLGMQIDYDLWKERERSRVRGKSTIAASP